MPGRVWSLLAYAELVLDEAMRLVQRVEDTRALVEAVALDADRTRAAADRTVAGVTARAAQVGVLVDRLTATTVRIGESAGTSAVDDAVVLLRELRSVAPDLRDLVAASHELNEMLGGLPGMGRIKKKVEEAQTEAE